MKKLLKLLGLLAVASLLFVGCGPSSGNGSEASEPAGVEETATTLALIDAPKTFNLSDGTNTPLDWKEGYSTNNDGYIVSNWGVKTFDTTGYSKLVMEYETTIAADALGGFRLMINSGDDLADNGTKWVDDFDWSGKGKVTIDLAAKNVVGKKFNWIAVAPVVKTGTTAGTFTVKSIVLEK